MPFDRLAWINIIGAPISIRDRTFFDKVAESLGKVVIPSAFSWTSAPSDSSKCCILSSSLQAIDELVCIQWKNVSFPVRVLETSDPLPPLSTAHSATPIIPASVGVPPSSPAAMGCDAASSSPPPSSCIPNLHGKSLPMHENGSTRILTHSPRAAHSLTAHIVSNHNKSACISADFGPDQPHFIFNSSGPDSSLVGRSKKRPRNTRSPSSVSPPLPSSFSPGPSLLSSVQALPLNSPNTTTPTVIIDPPAAAASANPHPGISSSSTSTSLPSQANQEPVQTFPSPLSVDHEISETIRVGSQLGFLLDNSHEHIAEIINGERGDSGAS